MRNVTCCLLVVLFGSWSSSLGQNASRKFTSPKIVATFERLGQTHEMKPVTLYTPPQWGTFRISVVMVLTVPGATGEFWYGGLQFVDAAGVNCCGAYNVALQSTIRGSAFGEFPIRARAGKPIKFSVQPGGDNSGSKYNVWVVVEQLM